MDWTLNPVKNPKPNTSYYGVECERCKLTFAGIEDPDRGMGNAIQFLESMSVNLRCADDACAHVGTYRPRDIIRFVTPGSSEGR